jgi:hypothetical protein
VTILRVETNKEKKMTTEKIITYYYKDQPEIIRTAQHCGTKKEVKESFISSVSEKFRHLIVIKSIEVVTYEIRKKWQAEFIARRMELGIGLVAN